MLSLTDFLEVGMTARIKKVVQMEDASGNASSYLNSYLSTAACAAFSVAAAMAITDGRLPEGYLSVGSRLELEHKVPAMLETVVTVEATLKEIRGNRLIFSIVGSDALGEVFTAENERAVVNRLGLDEKAAERAAELHSLKEKL